MEGKRQSFEVQERLWKAYLGVAGLFVLTGLGFLAFDLAKALVFLGIGLFVGASLVLGGRPRRG